MPFCKITKIVIIYFVKKKRGTYISTQSRFAHEHAYSYPVVAFIKKKGRINVFPCTVLFSELSRSAFAWFPWSAPKKHFATEVLVGSASAEMPGRE